MTLVVNTCTLCLCNAYTFMRYRVFVMESNNDDDIFHEKGHSMVYSLPAVCAEEYRFLEQA